MPSAFTGYIGRRDSSCERSSARKWHGGNDRHDRLPHVRMNAGRCDFVSDKLADGRSFRILTVVDLFTRECVWLEADRSMTGAKVATALTKASLERGGPPVSITCDNGSEFASKALES